MKFSRLAHIPPRSARNVTLRVDRSGERALRQGHPWLFEAGVRSQSREGRSGDHAVIFDRDRRFLAIGLYDPSSPIRVRILHSGKPCPLDDDFFRRRLRAIVSLRAELERGGTNGYRLVNGENEGMPGFTVDRYDTTLVVKLYTTAWLPHLAQVLDVLLEVQPAQRVVLRLSREVSRRREALHGLFDGALIYGPEPERVLCFRENHLRFECDPVKGQKTGFFLDQRENRARVEGLASGRRVLNVFSYTGGFSLYAARGGAEQVVSLDASRPALAAARRNFELNRSDPAVCRARHEVRECDAFAGLESMSRRAEVYDLVIIDPPAFARREAEVAGALASYGRLVELGLAVLAPGGRFVMASCSSRVGPEDFYALVHRAASRARRPLEEIERTGHALDHPVGFQQGSYLKCLFARAS